MKNISTKSALFVFLAFMLSDVAHAQRGSAKGSPSAQAAKGKSSSVKYRLMANYDFIMTNPSSLNTFSSGLVWNGTTSIRDKFSNMNGYSISGGYLANNAFWGLEYGAGSQELPQTIITPTTQTLQYTFDYQTVYFNYDRYYDNKSYSYEWGIGLGYALKFQYHWIVQSGGTTEDVIWQANPMALKIKGAYNYHFSSNVMLRAGVAYEYVPATAVKSDAAHPTIGGIVSGQTLRDAAGQDVKIDISGLRLNLGLIVAF